MGKKVIVAGHICLDITPVFSGREGVKAEELLLPGKLVQVGEADVHTGGSVANTGLAMKFLGADVSLMGKIGNDEFGHMIRNILGKYGAQEEMLIDDKETTSYSVILAIPGIDRIFLHHSGANHTFRAEDIKEKAMEEAALLHFGYPPLMKSMYENEGEELLKLMKRAKDVGMATSLDMAAVDPASEAGIVDWRAVLEKVIPYVDFFVPSVEELCYMIDRERYEEWQARAQGKDITALLDIEKDVRPLADRCMKLGSKVLVIKCGVKGMYYRTADRITMLKTGVKIALDLDAWSEKEGFERSYRPERVLSGTGAGDTSIGAFLTAVTEGYPIEDAMHLAAATGASCVASYDALSGLKSFDELSLKIKNGWEKQ